MAKRTAINADDFEHIRLQLIAAERDLKNERFLRLALEHELQRPLNVHYLRRTTGDESIRLANEEKIKVLEKMLNRRDEELVRKDDEIAKLNAELSGLKMRMVTKDRALESQRNESVACVRLKKQIDKMKLRIAELEVAQRHHYGQ